MGATHTAKPRSTYRGHFFQPFSRFAHCGSITSPYISCATRSPFSFLVYRTARREPNPTVACGKIRVSRLAGRKDPHAPLCRGGMWHSDHCPSNPPWAVLTVQPPSEAFQSAPGKQDCREPRRGQGSRTRQPATTAARRSGSAHSTTCCHPFTSSILTFSVARWRSPLFISPIASCLCSLDTQRP